MAYNKTTWKNGDVITAEKLNNIETGIEDSRDTVYIEGEIVIDAGDKDFFSSTMGTTINELYQAGKNIVLKGDYQGGFSFYYMGAAFSNTLAFYPIANDNLQYINCDLTGTTQITTWKAY